MESVNTFNLTWEGKLEPTSPNSSSHNYIEDMIFEDNFANDLLINQLNSFDSKKSVEEILWELDNGKHFSTDEDIPSTNDNKINVPIFDFMSAVDTGSYNIDEQTSITQSQFSAKIDDDQAKTEELLMEFDNVFDAVELNHLTPPQTPPGQYSQQIVSEQHGQTKQLDQVFYTILNEEQYVQQSYPLVYQPQIQNYIYDQNVMQTVASNLAEQEIPIIFENTSDNSLTDSAILGEDANILIIKEAQEQQSQILTSDIARELEVVDELVRSRAKDLPDDEEDYSSGISSISFSPRSDESSSGFSQDDDEWPAHTSKKSRVGAPLTGVTKKRTRPYIRGSEDKKTRKKEQNKNAATRYRQKKKQEIEVILDEEKILLDKHQKLVIEYKDKKREMTYLRGLLKELFKAKGLL